MTWDSSSQYSKDKLQNMQQEAIERVQEMQRRSNIALKNAQRDPAFYSNPQPHLPRPSQTNEQNKNSQPMQNTYHSGGNFNRNSPSPQVPRHNSQQNSQNPQNPQNPHIHEESLHDEDRHHADTYQENAQNKDFAPDASYQEIPEEEENPNTSGLGSILNGFLSGLGLAPSPQGRDTLPKLLKALNLDNERLLILLLVFLLYSDGADYTLLFALLYLFL